MTIEMQTAYGGFPFGRPNTVRPARFATAKPLAAVVGVYPSAWHVTWNAPAFAHGEERRGAVKALAVDVEPTVFWDGSSDDFGTRLAAWRDAVAFVEGNELGRHGYLSALSPSSNGSSGRKVVDRYLSPLKLDAASVTFTDICPVFFVKHAARSPKRREQGDAIRQEYDSIARQMAVPASTLPVRPSAAKVPAMAAANFADRLVADLAESSADLIITLGAEVWDTLLLIPELRARPPAPRFEALYGSLYGTTGTLSVAGRACTWLPLVHPGLLKGAASASELDAANRTAAGWNTLHSRWAHGAVGP